MSTCACVLSKNGERLMPTIRLGKVRHLLKDGKAKIMPKKWVKIKPPRKLTEEQYAELVRRGKELAERQRQAKNLVKE